MLATISWIIIAVAALTLWAWGKNAWDARKARKRIQAERERLASALRENDGYDSEGWPI